MHQGPSTLRVFVNKLYYFSGKGHVVFWKCDCSIVFLISRRVRCITVFNALVRFNASTFSISSTVSALKQPHSWIEPQVMWEVQFLGVFLNKPPLFGQKVHFLRYHLNWPPPKNPYWKKEPRGSNDADTVSHYENAQIREISFFEIN